MSEDNKYPELYLDLSEIPPGNVARVVAKHFELIMKVNADPVLSCSEEVLYMVRQLTNAIVRDVAKAEEPGDAKLTILRDWFVNTEQEVNEVTLGWEIDRLLAKPPTGEGGAV